MISQSALTQEREFPPCLIGVIADTHIFSGGRRQLAGEVISVFSRYGVDLILHAGDANDWTVIEQLRLTAPVIAVVGNNDVKELAEKEQEKETLVAGSVRIGLIHGHQGRTARETARASFRNQVDVVVYGHSHIPKIELDENRILFNPGSPSDRRWSEHFGIGLLDCRGERVDPTLILFRSPAELDGMTPSR